MRGLLAMLLCSAATAAISPAAAQQLELDGAWGNEAGCRFAATRDHGDDSFVVLKPDGVQTYGTLCDWVAVHPGKDRAQVAIGLCGYEGEEGLGAETFVIAPDMSDPSLMKIYADNGQVWGEVRKCP